MSEILVVDDVATLRVILSRHVREMGHQVSTAGNGLEALALLERRRFDLVLLDVLMPEMDGYEVLGRIKSDAGLRDIPVVMVSGVEELESVVRCLERGAEDYLFKPFNPTLLRARVEASLEKKRLWDELQANYRRLQELEQLRDSLVHMVVHDMRTPLTALTGGLATVEELGDLNSAQREFLAMAQQGGEMLLAMINDLLDISKMEDGSLKLALADLDAARVVEEALAQVAPLTRDRRLALQSDVPPDLPVVRADAEKVRRILVNLLGNAVRFTPPGGRVSVSVRESECGGLEFAVADTGEGIAPEHFERIFEKFAQVESRRAGRTASSGLGLTFCKMAVEAHGGRIWVESELGRGSTFRFLLPRSIPFP